MLFYDSENREKREKSACHSNKIISVYYVNYVNLSKTKSNYFFSSYN